MALKEYKCDSCGELIPYAGKGRPSKYCDDCKSITETNPAGIRPPSGVPVLPPDIPQTTILERAAPRLIELTFNNPDPWVAIEGAAKSSDDEITNLDRRITLLARYIIEATLWDAVGLSKKERFDAAVGAIKTLEGNKSNVWVKDEKDKNIPVTQKQFFKEKQEVSERLIRLLKEKERIDDPEVRAAAVQIITIEGEGGEDAA